jgi:IS6 family transposase
VCTSPHGHERPRVLDELLPAACHVVERHANNPIVADHGRLKSRLRGSRTWHAGTSFKLWPQTLRAGGRHEELRHRDVAGRTAAVFHGMAGAGKTACALELA